jgi:hypothetical protein
MEFLIRRVFLAKGDQLNGLEEPRVLTPGVGFSIGPSIYADVVLTTAGGTRRATGGRRCCAFYLDAVGKLWLHHGGRLDSCRPAIASRFSPRPATLRSRSRSWRPLMSGVRGRTIG